jgi:hypothetical protein
MDTSCSTCTPLGTGAHPTVRALLDRLKPRALSAAFRALAEADALGLIAAAAHTRVASIRIMPTDPVGTEVRVHLVDAKRQRAGQVRVHVGPAASDWTVSVDAPEKLQHAIAELAPAWVTVHGGAGGRLLLRPPVGGNEGRQTRWNHVIEAATQQRLERLAQRGLTRP